MKPLSARRHDVRSSIQWGDRRELLEEATAKFLRSCWTHGIAKDKLNPFKETHQITAHALIGVEGKREEAATCTPPAKVLQTEDRHGAQS